MQTPLWRVEELANIDKGRRSSVNGPPKQVLFVSQENKITILQIKEITAPPLSLLALSAYSHNKTFYQPLPFTKHVRPGLEPDTTVLKR